MFVSGHIQVASTAHMQTHHLPTDLRRANGSIWGRASRAIWAIEPTNQAILFVHGFGGSATGTWVEFPRFLPMEDGTAGYDVLFYGYDGKRASAAFSARELLELLDALSDNPAGEVINPSLPPKVATRSRKYRYRKLVICAHSLGAVVTRIALLDAGVRISAASWLGNVTLVLFAPAHLGAGILRLVSTALPAIVIGPLRSRAIEAALRYMMPVLNDLDEGCRTLKRLEERTRQALRAEATENVHLIANVIHGGRDNVVIQDRFVCDFEFIPFPGRGHTKVCKPELGFTEPLTTLLRFL